MEEPPPIPEPTTAVQAEVPSPPRMSLLARLLNVFAVPGEVFDDIKVSVASSANWLVPSLLLLVVSWVSAWLILSQPAVQQQLREMTDQVMQKLVEKGRLTQQQADLQRRGSDIGSKVGSYVSATFVAFITPFGWGAILWVIGTKALKGKFQFMKAVEVVGVASTISALGVIVKTLLVIGLGNMFAGTNPSILVKDFDPQKPSHSMLAVIDLTTFWVLAVRALGLSRLSGAPFLRAAWWVFAIWLSYTSLLLGIGLAVRAAFGL